ncbi:CS1 type fimbrial major subunit [Rosenbergiella nectarea]|uniref:CS1 type fimbrial major subunit n=1 Tax=Rosenbergiella nectarea TaxID=988801 RepID=A0A1H9M9U5_9GAMM|nr:CS1 type fimbrial major subunit [Rosenbergiella nectarea]SER20454.1 CS1 type fimbrial major subunit [Rosenbergiella nectarea]
MKNQIKAISIVSLFAAVFSVSAAQQDITVTAQIDPTVDITLDDGSPLPTTATMQYLPGKGLGDYSRQVKLWSNNVDRDLLVSLVNSPSLTDETGTNDIALKVTLNGSELSTSSKTMTYATTFPNGIEHGSTVMPLVISQATPGLITKAGRYTGIVSIVVAQAAAAQNSGN